MLKRKLLAMLGMTIATVGTAVYMSIKDMKGKTKSVLLNHEVDEETPNTEQSGKETEEKENQDCKSSLEENRVTKYKNAMVPSKCGALHVEGKTLVDKNGKAIQLKGISTHGIGWYPQFVNADCFQELHEKWNMNLIRLALYTEEKGGYCTDGDQEQLKQLVRDGVKYAVENDMYVIIDWHILSDYDPNKNKEAAIAFFDEMSAEFASCENVLYEICNEPNGDVAWEEIRSYAEEVIPVIRTHAPNAVIIVGTPKWSQRVDEAAAHPVTEYENIMYALHFYAGTHKEELRSLMISAIIAGMPLFVTEYGICSADGNGDLDYDSAQKWIDVMNAYNISYAMWNLGNKDESSCIIKADCEKVSGFTDVDLNDSGKWLRRMLTE